MKHKVAFKLENYLYILDTPSLLLDYLVSASADRDRFYRMKLEMLDSTKLTHISCSHVGENSSNILQSTACLRRPTRHF